MRSMRTTALVSSLLGVALLCGCPEEKAPPKTDQTQQAEKPEQPEEPGSQPGSAASMPDDHSTSSTAVRLQDLFKMPESPDVVAKVNDRPVVRDELEGVLRQTQIQLNATGSPVKLTRFRILDGAVEQLVDLKLRHELAEELGVKGDPAYAKAWLEDLEARMRADKSFGAFLLRAGKDADARKRDAGEAALMAAIVDKLREEAKEELLAEAKKYYERNEKQYFMHEGVQAWRLFVKAPRGMVQRDRDIAKTRAEDLHAKATKTRKAEDFENLVKSHSEGGKASSGGYIGYVAKGTFNENLEKQIYAAKPNTVLPLYEDAHGYYIYFIGEHRDARQKPFDEVKEEILSKVYRTIIDREMNQRLEVLRKKQKVEIFIPELVELRKQQQAKGPGPRRAN